MKYLDGGNRGKPRNQWDTSVDDVRTRHTRVMQQFPTRASRFSENVQNGTFKDGFSPAAKTRLVPYSLLSVSSEESIPLRISNRSLALSTSPRAGHMATKLPNIHDNQRISTTHSALGEGVKRPGLPHAHTTLGGVLSYPFTRRLSRSLSDLEELRQRSKTFTSAV